ncbi:MAG: AraC family transcriptional regulator, partial [Spirochaetaceae bacterium]
DIPIYDTLRMIMSPSLLRILKTEKDYGGNQKERLLKKILADDEGSLKDESYKSITARRSGSLYVKDILSCLYHYIDEVADINKFSKFLNVGPSTLMRKTKILTGLTVQKLHEKMKMEKAMILLENNEFSINEIAEKLGYSTQFYFSNVFKKYTGISPRKWVELKHG